MANEINAVAGQLWGIPMGEVYTAGPGIKIDNVHKVVSVDETVLWEGTLGATGTSIPMSESVKHFEKLKIYIQCKTNPNGRCKIIKEVEPTFQPTSPISLIYVDAYDRAASNTTMNMLYLQYTDETTASLLGGSKWVNNTFTNSITSYDFNIVKIIGINRKSA